MKTNKNYSCGRKREKRYKIQKYEIFFETTLMIKEMSYFKKVHFCH